MKILSNFDTHLDEDLLVKAQERFGKEHVLFVRRDKIYLVLKIYIPIIAWFLSVLTLVLIFSGMMSGNDLFWTVVRWSFWWTVIASLFVLTKYCTGKMIDYYMDYAIVTPEQVTQFDQSGVLERSTRALDITKVKTVSVNNKGLLCSLFNYGSIIFFSEGDSAQHWDIRMNYITDPIKLRDKINQIVRKWVLLDQQQLWNAIHGKIE